MDTVGINGSVPAPRHLMAQLAHSRKANRVAMHPRESDMMVSIVSRKFSVKVTGHEPFKVVGDHLLDHAPKSHRPAGESLGFGH